MKKINCALVLAFNDFIRASKRGKRRLSSGSKISPGTIRGYEQTLRVIQEFSLSNSNVPELTHLRSQSPEQMRKQVRIWKKFTKEIRESFYKKEGYSDSYVQLHFKNLKTFLHYMERDKGWRLGPVGSCFNLTPKTMAPVVLSPEQVQYLFFNEEFLKKLPGSFKRIRIIFLIGCFTGLRFSDLMALRKSNLILTDGKISVRLVTQKTGQVLDIPLPGEAILLLKELKGNRTIYLLPRISSVNFNLKIKKLIEIAGWNYLFPKYQGKAGKLTELKKEGGRSWCFHEHITAHTMRRTAITTLLRRGVPENIVRAISGHAPGSKEFYKYVSLSKNWMEQEVLNAWSYLTPSKDSQ